MRGNHSDGFILLEVLLAMGLISGVWISSIGVYHGLVAQLIKQERKQVFLRQTFDEYELAEQARVNSNQDAQANVSNFLQKDSQHDPSRVSRRHRPLRSPSKSSSTR